MKWFTQTLIESTIKSAASMAGFIVGLYIWTEAVQFRKSEEP